MKHTKGNWSFKKPQHIESDFNGTSDLVATVYSPFASIHDEHDGDEEIQANAKLIAAAPEMLEALLRIDQIFRDQWNRVVLTNAEHDEWNKVKQLIKKATE